MGVGYSAEHGRAHARGKTTMFIPVQLEVKTSADLSETERRQIIALCTDAYEEDFSDFFTVFPETAHVLARIDVMLVSHAAWVTRWLETKGEGLLRTAYVEAVATAPEHQRRGYAKAVMKELGNQIASYDLGALSPSDPAFYEPLGWELWRGALAIRTQNGLLSTPPDEVVMIKRLERSRTIDVNQLLTAEWRQGELW